MSAPGTVQKLLMHHPRTDKVGKCPAIALGGGGGGEDGGLGATGIY